MYNKKILINNILIALIEYIIGISKTKINIKNNIYVTVNTEYLSNIK